ncbi:MAG: helix-turn-helix domain-containing protein, partial [Acidimicrobiales bacterium]
QREALGSFIRAQRKLANMSLRELADLTDVSNPYLSQVERGLHAPSVRVLQSIARALNLSADMVMTQAGWFDPGAGDASAEPLGTAPAPSTTETAIRTDPRLTAQQKESLLAVYRSYVGPERS